MASCGTWIGTLWSLVRRRAHHPQSVRAPLLALVALSTLALSACGQPPADDVSNSPPMPPALAQVQFKHLAFIGDSITVGVAASAQRLTYQQRVLVAVGATQSSTLAHSGWTTFDALTALTSRPETVADADVIIVELGTNDDSPRQSGTEGDWQATYSILLSLVRRDAPPDARLICLTPWRGSAEKGAHGVPSTHYAAWVAAACFANGGISVRLAPLYDDPANRTPPDFHPNDRGHGAIAAAILAVLGVRTT